MKGRIAPAKDLHLKKGSMFRFHQVSNPAFPSAWIDSISHKAFKFLI
ncbi:MAG: hypothetical protein AB7H48_01275 [Parachlamydiales bacterium]